MNGRSSEGWVGGGWEQSQIRAAGAELDKKYSSSSSTCGEVASVRMKDSRAFMCVPLPVVRSNGSMGVFFAHTSLRGALQSRCSS